MALVKPFRAWHYDPKQVTIERVVAPPYDVISESDKEKFHTRDPYNIIRLILGQPKPGESDQGSKYAEARAHLDEWIRKGILTQEPRDGFYLYEMNYRHPFQNKILTRLSLFAALKLEPFERKVVFPHEKTHASPKVDRGKLLRATEANFSSIFALYEDASPILDQVRKKCDSRTPLFDFTDEKNIHHRLWLVDGPNEIKSIAACFDRRRIFIADGHHRYETALKYAEEMNQKMKPASEATWQYVLTTFVRFNDPGLLILPIHRVVLKSVLMNQAALVENLKRHFILHPVSRAVLEKISEGSIAEGFGLAFSENECYLLELKDKTAARQHMPQGKPSSWYELDMNLVSYLILEPILGIKEANLERSIFYTPSIEEALGKLKTLDAHAAFFIRPVTAQTIKDICESGELMPQKSTYFYPKFPSGLLIYKH